MYFTQALTVALSLSAAAVKAAPVPGSQKDTSNLVLRSVHESQIAVRSVGISDAVSSRPLQARGLDPVTHLRRAIDLRFGNVDPKARDLAMVTELHRRGLLDQLIAALRDLIITLLGKGGGMTRRQASTEQLEQAIHQVTCILDALFGNTDSDGTCADVLGGAANSTNATGTAANRTVSPLEKKLSALGAQLRNGTSITEMVDDYMAGKQGSASTAAQASKAVPAAAKATGTKKADKKDKPKHHSAKNATSTDTTAPAAKQQQKRSTELLEARQDSGLTGLLVALRDVVDTILNTLLPMSSRAESDNSTSTSSSSGKWPPQDCPPPTPNDGMYRPGCPGYGRRDIAVRRSMDQLGERDANILQSIMPMIQMLLEQLPALIKSMASDPNATSTVTSVTNAGTTTTGPTAAADDAFSQIMSALGYGGEAASPSPSSGSKTGSAAKAQSTGAAAGSNGTSSAARSAANLSQNFARDLLDGDGMNLGKRQTGTGGVTDGVTDAIGSDNCDASGNSGGINVSLLNNLLNGLLSGLGRRSEDSIPLEFFKRQATTDDGDNVIGSGNCSASNNTGGVNLSLLDNLLNGLLSGIGRRDVPTEGMVSVEALKRDAAEPLAERADFAPVWTEIKKIGNEHFHVARDLSHTDETATAAKRDANADNAPDFTPVWEAFRDLVDSGYSQAAEGSSAQRRDAGAPLKLDYKPLMKAGIKFGKQVFKSFTSQHAKRSTDFKPFVDAASSFAATAIKEMWKSS
ncbi:hypothetical protein L1887_61484 [Cichorium endivia]|nr:hypothetical protein L1887_61484 [Cichorium endivia]